MSGRFYLPLLLALIVAIPVFSYEYGVTVTNDSTGIFTDISQLEQKSRATGWFNIQTGTTSDLHLSLFYEYYGTFSKDSSEVRPWRFDFGRSDFSGFADLGPGRLRYALGRTEFHDFSARLISGLADGVRATYQMGNLSILAAGGYRGLLYKEDANSFFDDDDSTIYQDDDAYFGPKRMFVASGVRLNEFIPFHDFGLEGWAQFDLEDGGTRTNTQYVEPFVEGRLGRSLRWRSWSAMEFGTSDSDPLYAMAAGLRLRYSAPELLGLLVTGTALWASGDTGSTAAFTPIKQGSIATVSSLTFTDTAKIGLDVALAPIRGTSATLGGAALFRSSDDAPADGTLRDDAEGSYLGTEITAQGAVRPTTDLLVSLWGGVLFPNTSVYVSDTPNKWKIGLSLVFNM